MKLLNIIAIRVLGVSSRPSLSKSINREMRRFMRNDRILIDKMNLSLTWLFAILHEYKKMIMIKE